MAKQDYEVSNAFIQHAERLGHKIIGVTDLPRHPGLGNPKKYVWMRDGDGTHYLEPLW